MAQICTNCKFTCNPDDAIRCQQCNSFLRQSESNDDNENFPDNGEMSAISATADTFLPETPITPPANQNQLIGKITWIENAMENVDFNFYKFATQLCLFLIFIPLIVLILIISTALWISFAILGFRTLSRGVSPFNIVNTINSFGILFAVIFPRVPQINQVPVFRLTIKTDQGERPAILKGEMVSGTFRKGDDIEFTGEWRQGTLVVRRGYNHSLQTSIALRRDYWIYAFFTILSLFIFLGIYFLIGGQ